MKIYDLVEEYHSRDLNLEYHFNSRCCCNERPQRLDKILIYFYQHFIEELSKVVFKKTVSCNTPVKLDAIMFAQHTLVINVQEVHAFHTAYACYKCVFLTEFSCKQLC